MAPSAPSRTPGHRRRAGLGLAAAALLALTACGGGEPQGAPAPAPASEMDLPPMDMAPFTLDIPDLDLALVPGASVTAIEGADPEHHGAWLDVPEAPVWTRAMSDAVHEQVEDYRRDTDHSTDPTLEVRPRLAVAGADIGAVRLLSTETRGADSVSAARAVWYSPREDRVLQAPDLFTAEGWDAFRAEVRNRMTNDPDIVQERLSSAVDTPERAENLRIWDAIVFLPDGSALLEVDQAALAPAAAGVLTTRIPAETVRPWLSALGTTAQAAGRTPGTLDLPEPAASEQPSTSGPAVPPPASSTAPGSSSSAPAAPAPGTSGAPGTSPSGVPTTAPGPIVPVPGPTPDPTSPNPTSPVPDPTTPAPRPEPTGPRPTPTPPSPTPDPTTPAPTPDPTTPAPSPTQPTPTPTTPRPTPDPTTPAPTPDPTSPAPTPTDPTPDPEPSPGPTDPAPTDPAPTPEPTVSASAAPSTGTAEGPSVPPVTPTAGTPPTA